jgi:hypothetical protein
MNKKRARAHLITMNSTGGNLASTWSMVAAAPPETTAPADGFYALIAPEEVWSSDGRRFAAGALAPREGPNEMPLMGLIENTDMHDRAVNVGHFTRVALSNGWWEGYGVWADSPEANAIRERVRAGDVTGVSVDAAVFEAQYLIEASEYDQLASILDPATPVEDTEPERVVIDGVEYIVETATPGRSIATQAEMMGATIVPFPAFAGATITDLQADDGLTPAVETVTAGAAPVSPPRDWFELPGGHTDAYDVIIDDDGRIHGYPAATWSSCHLSFPDECVTPPRSESDYAFFKVGTVRCADGTRVATGPLTLRGGHADRTWSASRAMAFYDDTDSAFADVAIGEDEHGMWVAGALRPETSAADIRTAMASGFSGDWRAIGGTHELIALSAVNTPGFRRHASLYESDGLVASMIVDMPRQDALVIDEADALAASAIQRIAASIGRTPEQRIAALAARVHREMEVA